MDRLIKNWIEKEALVIRAQDKAKDEDEKAYLMSEDKILKVELDKLDEVIDKVLSYSLKNKHKKAKGYFVKSGAKLSGDF